MKHLLLGCALAFLLGCGQPGGSDGEGARDDDTRIYRWKLITTWPKNFPALGTAPERLADRLRVMSNGRLDIRVYGAGELVGAFEVFDAVRQGTAEMGHGAAYYWRGKLPAAAMFTSVPFGMTAQETNAWLQYGGGLDLWRELYEPVGLVPLVAGNSGVQMAGWFNKEINSLEDLQGLQMRMPGLGGEVLRRAGAAPVSIPGGDMYTALQTGVIEATEWVGPYNDLALGLQGIGEYYYYPGWQEPSATMEAIVNKAAWEELPPDLQAMIEAATRLVNDDLLAEYTARNSAALQTLVEEHGVELRRLPDDVLIRLEEISREVLAEAARDSDIAQRIHASYTEFQQRVEAYHAISEEAYVEARGLTRDGISELAPEPAP